MVLEEKAVIRAKDKAARPPRTQGILYRYGEGGVLQRVLTEAEKIEKAARVHLCKLDGGARVHPPHLCMHLKVIRFLTPANPWLAAVFLDSSEALVGRYSRRSSRI